MSGANAYSIEHGVPMPAGPRRWAAERTAIRALAAVPVGASVMFPWADVTPDYQAKKLGRMAAEIIGTGKYTLRQVEGGFRVWKGRGLS